MQLLTLYTRLSPSSGSQMYDDRKNNAATVCHLFFKSKHPRNLGATVAHKEVNTKAIFYI